MQLINALDSNMHLTVFAIRYGGGYAAMLEQDGNPAKYVDALTSSYSDLACDLGAAISDLEWFPLGFGETPEKAIAALQERLGKAQTQGEARAVLYGAAQVHHLLYQYEKESTASEDYWGQLQILIKAIGKFKGGLDRIVAVYEGPGEQA